MRKTYFSKIILTLFYLLVASYIQCSYAIIENLLFKHQRTGREYVVITSEDMLSITPAIAAGLVQTLQERAIYRLDMGGLFFTPIAFDTIIEFLRTANTLTELNLDDDSLGSEEARALAEALLTNTALISLNLERNNIGAEGAQVITEVLRTNAVLIRLNLDDNNIGVEGAKMLAEVLRTNVVLNSLDLYHNGIGDTGVQALAEALRLNTALMRLNIDDNNIGAAGALALAEVLQINTALSRLSLCVNNIGDEGTLALAGALRTNTALTELDLGGNNIGDTGSLAFAETLYHNTALTKLNLRFNNISPVGIQAIFSALINNISLLQMGDIGFDQNQRQVVELVLLRNDLVASMTRRLSSFTFALGAHPRIGAGSMLQGCHSLVLEMILQRSNNFVNRETYNIIMFGTIGELRRYLTTADLVQINRIRKIQLQIDALVTLQRVPVLLDLQQPIMAAAPFLKLAL